MDSIIQTEKECYICGRTDVLHSHHCLSGTSNRAQSEKYGLKIHLCPMCHYMAHHDRATELLIKRLGQIYFEKTHTREEFIQTFGKSFILEDEL